MASKVIVIGGVNSSFREVFGKLEKLQAKQQFACAVIAGDLFGELSAENSKDDLDALLRGAIHVALPTYFTVGRNGIPEQVAQKIAKEDEVCPNLFYLGRRGVLTTSEGIKIVALGGVHGPLPSDASLDEKYLPYHTEADAQSLYSAEKADILITYQWPKGIEKGSRVPTGEVTVEGSQCVANVCLALKPRYHFSSTTDIFYEREPFFHIPEDEYTVERHITRFINLAPFSTTSKQKWLYAFTLDPKSVLPTSVPVGTTISPLTAVAGRRGSLPSQKASFSRFRQDDGQQRPAKRARKAAPGPSECFFCLSNPNIASHLIASIGNDTYITTAKGPLPTASTFSALGFPGHMLIIPLIHAPSLTSIEDSESRSATYTEMHEYRSALHSMLQKRADMGLGAVTWEVSRGRGVHIHWQYMPVDANLIRRGLVEAAFKVEAENLEYPKVEKRESSSDEPGDYFRVWIWAPEQTADGEATGSETTLVLPLSDRLRFDVQFGRTVMAKLLGLEDRLNWRDAAQSVEEEKRDVEAFKSAFQGFDFTI
ncbi:meiotically up-regulated 161 protein [Nannizzia gypsea CBS 118893]|uniref:Meiotically up-regulated 161 protein n=1 Tax=Arthroderma gypseum (strain ATCC MYA-4604 / CBS 118893) TaxID=535722 RepID=E4V6X2_ARTGP|nr:meiotically up-regulated 161 protein [Nannizzia gypsea CBS 118893]EFQ96838.1 meiotically up-regulated 161 protein [Nannizzia gypsea CBS 118893]